MEEFRGCDALVRDAALPAGDGCCLSCHDEWAEGYGGESEVEHNGATYFVCCAIATAYREAVPSRGIEPRQPF